MNLFKTFFIGGYECADLINKHGNRIDLLQQTGHDAHVSEDYSLLKAVGIKTVREGIRWSYVEKQAGIYDFSEVENRIMAAKEHGIQQLWDICHFGFPDDLMPTHPQFAERLAAICKAFAKVYRQLSENALIITPVNEISFLSWLGGEARGTVPFAVNSGFDQKYHLCKASIKAIEAIKEVDAFAKVMVVEPLIRVHPQIDEDTCEAITGFNEAQFQAMDMITGRMCPELGGKPEYMDLAGFNYYYNNQWEHCGPVLGWCKIKRRACFSDLLHDAYLRYHKPVVISETGHFGEDRSVWMEQITEDCIRAMAKGVDLQGICIYPVLDRPDWDDLDRVIPCGLWGYNHTKQRVAETGYLATVTQCISLINDYSQEIILPNENRMII